MNSGTCEKSRAQNQPTNFRFHEPNSKMSNQKLQASVSGPMFEPASSEDWKSVHQKEGAHYNTFYVNHHSGKSRASDLKSMAALRSFFPNGEASEMNFCLFSTSGVHGMYTTIEEVESDLDKPYPPDDDFDHSDEPEFKHSDQVTFLIVQPRIVCLRYGNVLPKTKDDIDFLKKLRASSHEAVAKIGFQS